jgi:hypothetical protein
VPRTPAPCFGLFFMLLPAAACCLTGHGGACEA